MQTGLWHVGAAVHTHTNDTHEKNINAMNQSKHLDNFIQSTFSSNREKQTADAETLSNQTRYVIVGLPNTHGRVLVWISTDVTVISEKSHAHRKVKNKQHLGVFFLYVQT